MIRRPPRSTPLYSSAASDVYKRQLNSCAHAIALNHCHDRHVAVKHGLQTTPDVVLVKVAQARLLEPEGGIFRNITTGTKVRIVPSQQHTAQIPIAMNALKNRAQLTPHETRHGIEFGFMTDRDPRQTGLLLKPDRSTHTIFLHAQTTAAPTTTSPHRP